MLQIVLGIASYGHSFYVTTTAAVDAAGNVTLYPPFDKTKQPLGDSDAPGTATASKCSFIYQFTKTDLVNSPFAGTDACGNPGTPAVSGIFNFKGMVSTGFLDASGAPAQGINYRFDNCSQTVRVSGLIYVFCYLISSRYVAVCLQAKRTNYDFL